MPSNRVRENPSNRPKNNVSVSASRAMHHSRAKTSHEVTSVLPAHIPGRGPRSILAETVLSRPHHISFHSIETLEP